MFFTSLTSVQIWTGKNNLNYVTFGLIEAKILFYKISLSTNVQSSIKWISKTFDTRPKGALVSLCRRFKWLKSEIFHDIKPKTQFGQGATNKCAIHMTVAIWGQAKLEAEI